MVYPRVGEGTYQLSQIDSEEELIERELLWERIEGICGTLRSVPYELISTDDLRKILATLYLV